MKTTYTVQVGNIGTVHTGESAKDARIHYREYRDQSQSGYGRAARETVTLLANGEPIKEFRPKTKLPKVCEIRALLIALKPDIDDDFRASEFSEADEPPGMSVTIGADNAGNWSYQTGDNSFTGGAYGKPHWALVYLYRRSDCTALAREAVSEIADLIASSVE